MPFEELCPSSWKLSDTLMQNLQGWFLERCCFHRQCEEVIQVIGEILPEPDLHHEILHDRFYF